MFVKRSHVSLIESREQLLIAESELVWIRVKSCSYRLTDQRLFVRRGWLAKHVNELELYRVKDVLVDQAGLQATFAGLRHHHGAGSR